MKYNELYWMIKSHLSDGRQKLLKTLDELTGIIGDMYKMHERFIVFKVEHNYADTNEECADLKKMHGEYDSKCDKLEELHNILFSLAIEYMNEL